MSHGTPLPEDGGASHTAVRWRELVSATYLPRAALVLLGMWLNAADSLVTATIMPSVARNLGGYAYFGWAVALYLLGAIVAGASAGQLSRRLGLDRAMVLAALTYAAGCVLGAAAPDIRIFMLGRLIQGLGAGWLLGFCYVAIGQIFPERLWARMFGAGAGVWGVASFLGPLIGGLFAAAGHWRGAFWLFAVQALVFAVFAIPLLRGVAGGRAAKPGPGAPPAAPLAWRTLVVLGAGVIVISAADIVQGRLAPASLMIVGIALMALAAVVNDRPGERLLPPEAVRPATTAGAGYAMIFALCCASAVFTVYEAAILQAAYGLSPLAAGYVISVEAIGWTVTALVVSGQPLHRHNRFIFVGASTIVAAVILLAITIGLGHVWLIVAANAVMGAGFGLAWSLVTRKVLSVLPDDDRAIGASALPTTQMIGGAIGAPAAGAIANLLGLARDFSAANALHAAPWLFAAFIPVAAAGWLAAARLATRPG